MPTRDLDAAATSFAEDVGTDGSVTVSGLGTRGGAVEGVRQVRAPIGIEWIQPAEMTIKCGAATPLDEIDAELAGHGQRVAMPAGGTVGGALAAGQSGIHRLGYGPMRDSLLQAHYVSAAGDVVKAGGPTVKNVSGFDLCRLLVGSRGMLGFLSDVILRTRPRFSCERWFTSDRDPWELLAEIYRPTSMLWDGTTTWVLLEGHVDDVAQQESRNALQAVGGPPDLPTAARWSIPPSELPSLRVDDSANFVAEIGVGVVHHELRAPSSSVDPHRVELQRRVKQEFDPTGRLNPGLFLQNLS